MSNSLNYSFKTLNYFRNRESHCDPLRRAHPYTNIPSKLSPSKGLGHEEANQLPCGNDHGCLEHLSVVPFKILQSEGHLEVTRFERFSLE